MHNLETKPVLGRQPNSYCYFNSGMYNMRVDTKNKNTQIKNTFIELMNSNFYSSTISCSNLCSFYALALEHILATHILLYYDIAPYSSNRLF